MKRILTLVLLAFSCSLFAQNFEGVLKLNDRVQLGDAQKTQELEENFKAPYRKELEKNKKRLEDPTLSQEAKAKLEADIKRQEEVINLPLMSNIVEVRMKGDSICTLFRNGSSAQLIVNHGEKVYDISHNRKTYELDRSKPFSLFGKAPQVTKTSEVMLLLNQQCTKYEVKSTEKGKGAIGAFWAARDIKDVNWKFALSLEDEDSTLFSQIEGLPLKVEIVSGSVLHFKDILSIERIAVANSDFEIPADYQENIPTATTTKKKRK